MEIVGVLVILAVILVGLYFDRAASRHRAKARRLRKEAERLHAAALRNALQAVARVDRERSLAYQLELTRFARVMSRLRHTELSGFELRPAERPRPVRGSRSPQVSPWWTVLAGGLLVLLGPELGLLWRTPGLQPDAAVAIVVAVLMLWILVQLVWRISTAWGRHRRAREELAHAETAHEAALVRVSQLNHLRELASQQELLVRRLRQTLARETRWLRSTRRRRRNYERFTPVERERLRSAVELAALLKRTIDMPAASGDLEPNLALEAHLRASLEKARALPPDGPATPTSREAA